MQRIDAHHVGTPAGCHIDELFELAIAADSPVGLRAQQIELCRDPPHARAVLERRREKTAAGGDDQEGVARHPGDR